MRIFLVRHGETPWNEEMRYQGQSDVPLSEKGRKQAEALREAHFNNQGAGGSVQGTEIKIAKVYSSDLKRAFETAKIIVGQTEDNKQQTTDKKNNPPIPPLEKGGSGEGGRLEIVLRKELREINYGVFEGVLLEDIKKNYSDILRQWWRDPLKARIPDGESLEELHERVLRCYHRIVDTHRDSDDNILIVSHGGPLRIIFMDVLGFSLAQARSFRVDNTSLSIVEYKNGKSVLTLLNDTCHLERR